MRSSGVLSLFVLLLALLPSRYLRGQESKPDLDPVVSGRENLAEKIGFSLEYQFRDRSGLSLGLGYLTTPERCGPMWGKGLFLNNEVVFANENNPLLYSPQISAFYWSLLCYFGGKLAYYTDFRHGTLQLAPEIGIGLLCLFVVYTKNIPLVPSDDIHPVTDRLSLKILLPSGMLGL